MTNLLEARFAKRFSDGALIEGRVTQGPGTVLALFGPSGCGKTTVLRCLAGLERPDQGFIRFGAEVWHDATSHIFLTPQARRIGFLSQDDTLFPHMTVRENVAFGLGERPSHQDLRHLEELLLRFDLQTLAQRRPRTLSGGQRQRVALARALAPRPRLLLLDEPLSALDAPTREELRRSLRRWLTELSVPTLLVTHDRIEVEAVADDVIIQEGGRCLEQGPVSRVFRHPQCLATARILGFENLFEAEVVDSGATHTRVRAGASVLTSTMSGLAMGQKVHVALRGEELFFCENEDFRENRFRCSIISMQSEGPMVRLGLAGELGCTVLCPVPEARARALHVGKNVSVGATPEAVHIIAEDTHSFHSSASRS